MKKDTSYRVILADDDVMMRQFLKTILMEAHCRIVGEAGTGREAVRICREKNPDLVCLDINMPVMDGLEALREIHRQQPDLPVVMVSGEHTQEHVQECIRLGASGFIIKPFNANRVIERIGKVLGGKPGAVAGKD